MPAFNLHVVENKLTTSITVYGANNVQVTTANKTDHAMVYVFSNLGGNRKLEEYRCDNMQVASSLAWTLAIKYGRNE